MDSTIACNTLETFHIPMFDPGTMCLIFLIVINAVNGAMDGEVTPDATRKSHWTNFAICETEVRVMVAYIVFELLFIALGYQIYINYLMSVFPQQRDRQS